MLAVDVEKRLGDFRIAARFEAAGGVRVRMGDHVLRTSTAGLAAIAALSMRLGRW